MFCRTVFFGEYECFGPGSNYTYRVSYGKQLGQSEAASYMDVAYIDGNEWLIPRPNYLLDTVDNHEQREFI